MFERSAVRGFDGQSCRMTNLYFWPVRCATLSETETRKGSKVSKTTVHTHQRHMDHGSATCFGRSDQITATLVFDDGCARVCVIHVV